VTPKAIAASEVMRKGELESLVAEAIQSVWVQTPSSDMKVLSP
jgi:hypothetical protein